jgi:hypothetical protein
MSHSRYRQTLKLDDELQRLMDQLAAEHPYFHRHRLARLAFRLGLRQLSTLGPDGVRACKTTDIQDQDPDQAATPVAAE